MFCINDRYTKGIKGRKDAYYSLQGVYKLVTETGYYRLKAKRYTDKSKDISK